MEKIISVSNGLGQYKEDKHGVSYTLLSAWMECREKARLKLSGWRSSSTGMGLTFGSICHSVYEEGSNEISKKKMKRPPSAKMVLRWIKVAEDAWRKEHRHAGPLELQRLELALMFAGAVMPEYYEYWWDDIKTMDVRGVEEWFSVPFRIPNGRWLMINGKWDAVYKMGKGLWLQESKTSSRIDTEVLPDILPLSMQSKMYLLCYKWKYGKNLRGFLRDIVRRPGLRQKKNESLQDYVNRCVVDVSERPDFYFHRYEICIGADELEQFEKEFVAILDDFWRWRWDNVGHYPNTNACQGKYGLCEMFPICARGDYSRHYQADWAKRKKEAPVGKVRSRTRSRNDERSKRS